MKIASSELQLTASHSQAQQHDIKESLRVWVGDSRPDLSGNASSALPRNPTVQISDAGQIAQSSEANAIQDSIDAVENDPMMQLIRAMIALLTGHEARVFHASDLQLDSSSANPVQAPMQTSATAVPQSAGYGLEYDRHESYSESEQTSFQANGVIRTADGKEINFSVNLNMARSYQEESNISLRLGDARATKDPLVLNFAGTAAQLSSQRFAFDLNADGQKENINFVTGGSGFLALDRNGDGKINDGSELFGAKTGNGFAELAALDGDHNGWIDENDAAYAQLMVWSKDNTGKDILASLKQANVGALSLAQVATPFSLKDSSNALLGQIRASGVFLQEDGKAGTIQQLDLTV